MKSCKFILLLMLTACSVTKTEVVNRPPVVPNLSGKLTNLYGTLDPLISLSAFFWPETRNGEPLTMAERQEIVSQVNIRGAKLDYLTDQQEAAQRSVCAIKEQIVQNDCTQFDLDPRDDEETCTSSWITNWKSESDLGSQSELVAQLNACKALVEKGQEQEQIPDQVATQKMLLQQELIQLLETEPSYSHFMFTDPANSKLEMTRGEDGEMQFRIKLAFTAPAMIYDSQEDPERGLIDHIEYDPRLHVLRFQMHEKVDGDVTGGVFQMTASRVLNSREVVRFSGEMNYFSPTNQKRNGRFKIDGYLQE